MRSLSSRLALPALSALLLSPTALVAQEERRAVPGNAIAIYDLVGRVTVEAGTGPDVVVFIEKMGRDGRRLEVEIGEVRGRNALRVIFPDDDIVYRERTSGWGSWSSQFTLNRDGTWDGDHSWTRSRRIRVKGSGSGLEAWANLRVQVPGGKQLDVNVGVGELIARNVSGDIRLDASSARITASGMKGRLRIESGSGGIELRDSSGEELILDTGSGGVDVRGVTARQCKFDTGSGGVVGSAISCEGLNVDVGSGSVRLDDVTSQRVKVDAGSGGVQIGLRNSPHELSVESGSGGVTIGLPSTLNAELDIETGSGGIESDFPVTTRRFERNHLRGTVGDGSGRIRIETGSGSVRLRKS